MKRPAIFLRKPDPAGEQAMINMSKTKNAMPEQAADIRNKNFDEVALGYSAQQAMDEAKRCLNCAAHPCMGGCPVHIHIPEFIACVADGDFEKAYEIITRDSSLPAVCGRVCPQETQCEAVCVRGRAGEPVAIGRLERFVADYHREHDKNFEKDACVSGANAIKPSDMSACGVSAARRVAVIGAGPSGLACAGDLARKGYDVTIFEALHKAGGVLVYGIPEFRLPKSIVEYEVDNLRRLGVKVCTDVIVGRSVYIDELFDEGYEAVFIGSGAGLPMFMNIPGEALKGVFSANEFLTRINLMKAYENGAATPVMKAKRVAVIGGGNVAMDAARCAKRLGADTVHIIYRRSESELPARAEEVLHAREEGIVFDFLTAPTEILGTSGAKDRHKNNFVKGLRLIKMELGEPDESGRRRPAPVAGSEYEIECDAVIMALGTSPNPLLRSTCPELESDAKGRIVTRGADGETSIKGVYAGGDAVTGAATVILAMGAGKAAAEGIDSYIKSLK